MTDTRVEELPPAGLVAQSGRQVPLLGVKVEAEVKDFCTRVTLLQRYRNNEEQPIEAVYVFPLEEGAAVCGFEALIDSARIVGEVKEKDAAFADYDDAIVAGHGAYLLDQECPDVFTASVGNLPPGKEVTIQISYVSELAVEGEDIRFVLPTTVSPRYAPEEDLKGVGRTPAEAVNPPRDWSVPYGLDLSIRFEMGSPIRSIESPSHAISVELAECRARVRLGTREAAMDRDFVLLAKRAEPHMPICQVERTGSGQLAALVAFQPDLPEEAGESACELIFIIDRSGSMGGTSIAEARNALQLCLRSLPPGSRFNIVGFGSTHRLLFPGSRPYDEESLRLASQHIQALQADLGGTEILPALRAVFESEPVAGLPRQLLILTDGQVSNTQAVISLVRKHSDRARVFAFGIGAGASHHLVRGMARAGEGAAEFIYPGERVEGKVMRQLQRVLAPALTDIRIEWGDLKVSQAPYRVPPVFSGGRVLIYGFLDDLGAGQVRLTAATPQGPVSFQLELDSSRSQPGELIARLAARTQIRDLEEGASALHDRTGSLQSRDQAKTVTREIVRLGVTYQLCSRETSFVAIEKRVAPTEGQLELRKIPVALTRGWGGLDSRLEVAAAMPPSATPVRALGMAAPSFDMLGDGDDYLDEPSFSASETGYQESFPQPLAGSADQSWAPSWLQRSRRKSKAAPASKKRPAGLDQIVRLQHADGSWDLTEELAAILDVELRQLEQAITGASGENHLVRKAWATGLALAWLEARATGSKEEWQLLSRKAERWLQQCPARLAGNRDWGELAMASLSF